MEDSGKRSGREAFPPALSWLAVILIASTIVGLSLFNLVPVFHTVSYGTGPGTQGAVLPNGSPVPGDPNATPVPGASALPGGVVPGSTTRTGAAASALKCAAGQNGGSTDVGVTATQIKIASTVVESGIGQSFLGPVPDAMNAVINRVNHSGGICGRTLSLTVNDDGWDASRGQGYIQNYIHQNYFALTVVPSSEGLKAASDTHLIDQAGIPVVGSDGMLSSQYTDPMIWPVATSTVSTAHISAKYSYDTYHPSSFGIVYDSRYHFGREGAFAYNEAVKRLTGHDIHGYNTSNQCQGAFCAIDSNNPDNIKNAVQTFNADCHPCGVVFLLLEPAAAQTFINKEGNGNWFQHLQAAQPLFNTDFASNCPLCAGMTVWSSYKPPIGAMADDPAVRQYVSDLKSVAPQDDETNAFTEGGYLGMELFVKALEAVGPNLTRAALVQQLNALTFSSGLTNPLSWSKSHFANGAMLGFTASYTGGWNGWRDGGTGWFVDPWLGQDTRSPF